MLAGVRSDAMANDTRDFMDGETVVFDAGGVLAHSPDPGQSRV